MKIFYVLCAIFSAIFALDSADSNLRFKNLDFKNLGEIKIDSFMVSEKFDGVRGIWDGKNMFSKRGNILPIPHCFSQNLAHLGLKNGEFVEGELWIDYGAFEAISGLLNRKNIACEDFRSVKFLIFNAQLGNKRDFSQNLAEIKSRLDSALDSAKGKDLAQIQVIPQHKFSKIADLKDFFNAVVAKGGEGLIVRDSTTAYKLKAQNDAECKIIDFSRGKGRLNGKVGAIICESLEDKNSGIKGGKIFRIGSGLSDEMRTNPPKIGMIITYKFSGVSKNGIPKHARFLRIYNEN